MTTGFILSSMTPAERKRAYACDVTYGTNNEFGFDYLRDNMAWSAADLVQRGHSYAIVDEVDSILIDEARTPLIISGPADQSSKWYTEFARLVPRLRQDLDYEVDLSKRTVGVTAGEVVVRGDDVDAVAGECVEVGRQRRDERLALTGLHLGDVAEVHRRAAHQLHLVVELAERAAGRLAHDRERLRQQVVEGLAVAVALLEGVGQRTQFGIGEVDIVLLERVDVIGDGRETADLLAFTGAQQLGENHGGHGTCWPRLITARSQGPALAR
jgi:hypothetical protein